MLLRIDDILSGMKNKKFGGEEHPANKMDEEQEGGGE